MEEARFDRKRAVFCLLATALFWSLGGVLIKSVSWDPMGIAGVRSAIAAMVLLLYRPRVRLTWSRAQVSSILSYVAVVILFVLATKNTTAANAILLQFTSPIYAALLGSVLLGERASARDWAIIGLVIAGIMLFFLDQLTFAGLFGNVCALLSGVAYGVFAVSMRMQKHAAPLDSVIIGNILAAVIGITCSSGITANLGDWGLLIALGTVQLGLPYVLYSYAIKHVTAMEAQLIPALEPILNPLWVLLVIGEVPGPWAFVGGTIVLVAVVARGMLSMRVEPEIVLEPAK